jgi:hypothetical protein
MYLFVIEVTNLFNSLNLLEYHCIPTTVGRPYVMDIICTPKHGQCINILQVKLIIVANLWRINLTAYGEGVVTRKGRSRKYVISGQSAVLESLQYGTRMTGASAVIPVTQSQWHDGVSSGNIS